nr:hypothetical protein [Streptomyces antibioticus]
MSSEDTPVRRQWRRHLVVGALIAVLTAQSVALVVQQGQINDLRAEQETSDTAGPSGPPGPPGPPGPRGLTGAAGKNGRDGRDGVSTVVAGQGGSTQTQLTLTEARAHCQTVADDAYPDGVSSGDETLDSLTDSYNATMRKKTFDECMVEQGYPQ